MNYPCPICKGELTLQNEKYKCINQECELRYANINVEEGYHNVIGIDKATQEVKTENKWCVEFKIKYD